MSERFSPPYPPRGSGPVAVWRGFFGERARNAVYGWSEAAFNQTYMRREVLGFTVHIPLEPDAIQHVLLDNAANYEKPKIVKGLLAPVIGRGLLTSDGSLWREQRRIVAASFVPTAVDSLVPVFADAAAATMARWDEGDPVDMAVEATTTTMRIIADSLFEGDPRLTSDEAMGHIGAALDALSGRRVQALLGLPAINLTAKARAGQRGQIYLRETLAAVVRDRFRTGQSQDFLGKLIAALGKRFGRNEAEALAIDNAATFYLAGHETTANAVAWTLFLLSEQPELQRQIAVEAQAALSVGADDMQLPDRLPLLRRTIEETLRLYPSAPRIDRQAVAADSLREHQVAAGDIISIWPWLIHRHKRLWDEPDIFDGDRFLPEEKAKRHRFQYIPFGGGSRVCVGAGVPPPARPDMGPCAGAYCPRRAPGRVVGPRCAGGDARPDADPRSAAKRDI
ncbi:MAG: cytochrome P450, partial [Sphingomonas bacterium]|nr:cytochrome P450 [Sphingomonas bacterium]